MGELARRRNALFSKAGFSRALLYNDDPTDFSPSFFYFSGCAVDGAYLLLNKKGGKLLTHRMNFRMAKELSHYPAFEVGKEGAQPFLKKEFGKRKAAFNAGEMNAKLADALRRKVKLKLADGGERMLSVRSEKSYEELSKLSKAAKIGRRILEALDPWECRSEQELARALKIKALEMGIEVSFEPIVATGRDSSFPHHRATGKKLEDFVLVDFGVRFEGYCSDFTRCYFRKNGMEEQLAYGKCVEVFDELLDSLPSCANGGEVAKLADKLVEKQGLPKMIHLIGHGVGLEVHEHPRLWRGSKDSLAGAVLAIEPAAYFRSYGVRFEEMVCRKGKGWKKL
jgi:Xaa-Pro aminopeptidase